MAIQSVNPATGELIRDYDEISAEEARAIVLQAHEAYGAWRRTSLADRAKLIHQAGTVLREDRDAWTELMATEMGKPVREGRAEIEKCAWACDFYAEKAEEFLAPAPVETGASRSFVAHEPLGVILAVMPWNFPFWQVFRFAAPSLMAGNTAVLKHASNVPGCALAIEAIFERAGLPENVFRTLLIGSAGVEAIIEDPHVMAVTLTGSTPAGRAVAAKAGSMLKKTVLELGGSDPLVVLADADLERAVDVGTASRLINGGQSCVAAKRFVVVSEVKEEFEQKFVEAMAQRTVGDPLEDETDIGPQARIDLRDELHSQVESSIAGGARLLLGGDVPKGDGAFYPPTVLTDVQPGTPAYDEELFGPVAAIITAADEEDAIRIANDTPFGLGAAVFTQDDSRGEEIAAHHLEAGCCFVNSMVKSDPRLPFGGIKQSGYGRELAEHGIKEFVNIKTVYVR